ncbi:ABC transporter permease [Planctomycetota bacterium]
MRIPLKYNVRNLLRRKTRSSLTAAGIMLVVVVNVFMFSFARGMLLMVKSSGSPDNIIVLDRKGKTCLFSELKSPDFNLLRTMPEIKKTATGEVMVSPELVVQALIQSGDYKNRPGVVRGITPIAYDVTEKIQITEGRKPAEAFEIAAGELAHANIGIPASGLEVGKKIEFEDESWTVVGRFSTGGTVLDGQLLANLADIQAVLNRHTYSAAVLKLQNPASMAPVVADLNARNDIQVQAISEIDYYKDYAKGFGRIIFLAITMAVICALGGLVGGMNTMYSSVFGRVREVATLQVLGFGKKDVILSFIVESLMLAIIGGIAGCLLGLLADSLAIKLAMGAFDIHVDWLTFGGGMLVAVVIGIIGALPPVIRATRMPVTDALRYN